MATAGAVLAAALSSCSLLDGPDPFDHPTSPGGQCIPLAGAKVVTDGLEMIQNHARTTAVIDKVALRRPKGLLLDRAWVVPTDAQLYGAAHGYPPQHYFEVVGWHWDRRMRADGARVPPLSSGKYFRMNIVVVVRLAPGYTRGRAAGIDMWYHVRDRHYYLGFETALVADVGRCSGFQVGALSEQQAHLDQIPELTIGTTDVSYEPPLFDEAELPIQSDCSIVMGENAQGQLMQATCFRPFDCRSYQRCSHATTTPVSRHHHSDFTEAHPARVDSDLSYDGALSQSDQSPVYLPAGCQLVNVDWWLGRDSVTFLRNGGEQ